MQEQIQAELALRRAAGRARTRRERGVGALLAAATGRPAAGPWTAAEQDAARAALDAVTALRVARSAARSGIPSSGARTPRIEARIRVLRAGSAQQERAARAAAEHAAAPEARLELAERLLHEAGAALEHRSESGSQYWLLASGIRLRVADHVVPPTHERVHGREGCRPMGGADLEVLVISSRRIKSERAVRSDIVNALSEGQTRA